MKSWILNILWFLIVGFCSYSYGYNNVHVIPEGKVLMQKNIDIGSFMSEPLNNDKFFSNVIIKEKERRQSIVQVINLPEVRITPHKSLQKIITEVDTDSNLELERNNKFEGLETLDTPVISIEIPDIAYSTDNLRDYLNA